jgi:adenylyltransferase/sulfurtransferase
MNRYSRQEVLSQIGPAGQARLRKSRVLVVGCGALGSVSAELLARAGVGFLRIVDRDLVEFSNLQRQVLFTEADAAQELPKAVAAANTLRQINSTIEIDPVVADCNALNIAHLGDVDVIVDGTDNIATRYLLNDFAVREAIPWVYGACVGTEGRVWGIWPNATACLRCVFPEPPRADELASCDTAGVLGPASATVGAMQAAIAMRFLVDGKQAAAASLGLLTLDAWTMQVRYLAAAARPAELCPCCVSRNFQFLSTAGVNFTTTLCGRQAVQVLRSAGQPNIDLAAIASRWENLGAIGRSPWFVRCKLAEPEDVELTLFADGRLLVHGVTDANRALSMYARFVGN